MTEVKLPFIEKIWELSVGNCLELEHKHFKHPHEQFPTLPWQHSATHSNYAPNHALDQAATGGAVWRVGWITWALGSRPRTVGGMRLTPESHHMATTDHNAKYGSLRLNSFSADMRVNKYNWAQYILVASTQGIQCIRVQSGYVLWEIHVKQFVYEKGGCEKFGIWAPMPSIANFTPKSLLVNQSQINYILRWNLQLILETIHVIMGLYKETKRWLSFNGFICKQSAAAKMPPTPHTLTETLLTTKLWNISQVW